MHASRRFASLSLVALLFAAQACAKDTIEPIAGTQPTAGGALEERADWDAAQAVVQLALRVDVEADEEAAAHSFWLFIERTPSGRLRAVIKDDPAQKPRLEFLVHDNSNLAIAGIAMTQPPAAWALGHYLFGQALEPAMLMQWSLGLPGQDFRMGEALAEVVLSDGRLARISQSGWQVEYGQWSEPGEGRPALPKQMRLQGDGPAMVVSVADMDAKTVAPEGYQEFSLR